MKKLIFVLVMFLAIQGMAQRYLTDTIPSLIFLNSNIGIGDPPKSLPSLHIMGEDIILGSGIINTTAPIIDFNITLSQLNEYGQLCYNDSTLIRKHQTNYRWCISYGEDCVTESHYKNIWIHKEPTLIGFLKWLNTGKLNK